MSCAPAFVDALLSDWLPPNVSICTPLVPSSKLELTRTRPPGSERYGSAYVRDRLAPNDVSLRMPTPKYVVCRPCAPPRQLVRSPSLAGSDVAAPNAGRHLCQPPLNERLYALPRVDAGGAKSMLPNT